MNKIFTSLLQAGTAGVLTVMCAAQVSAQISGAQMRHIARSTNEYLNKRQNGENVSLFHRFEIGYGLTYGRASVNIQDRFRDGSNGNAIAGNSRVTTFNYRASSGFVGTYFPLSYLSNKSILAINTGVFGTASVWDIGNTSLEENTVTSYEAKDVFIGVPLGVDYIYGGEATMNKSDKVTLRAGAGLMPFLAGGELADGSQDYVKLGIKPYIKAELGFFAAVEWKLKGMIVAGSRTIYDYKTGDYNLNDSEYYYSFNMKIKPTYTIGITVFPFSFGWDNDKW